MMTRSDLDGIRARLAGTSGVGTDTAHEIAATLLTELEHTRMRESVLRVEHANLLAAARAALAASDEGDTAPLFYLEDEVGQQGQRPRPDQPQAGHALTDAPALPDIF